MPNKKVLVSVVIFFLLLVGAVVLYCSAMSDLDSAMTQIKAAVALEEKAKNDEPEANKLMKELDVLKAQAERAENEDEFTRLQKQGQAKWERLDTIAQQDRDALKLREQSKQSITSARWKFKLLLMPLPEGAK